LGAAIATQAVKYVAGQAFGMDARQHRRTVADIAQHHGQMFFARCMLHERMQRELGPRRRQRARGHIVQFFFFYSGQHE